MLADLTCLLALVLHPPLSVNEVDNAQPPRPRVHTVNQRGKLDLIPAADAQIAETYFDVFIENGERVIRLNAIPFHETGTFPNRNNPHEIREQELEFRLPLVPKPLEVPLFYQLGTFGVTLNGGVLEPQAAEWYLGEVGSYWQYDPLGAAIPLGLDEHFAHVQPQGLYHYHGKADIIEDPKSLYRIEDGNVYVGIDSRSPTQIGWALDGYPIMAPSVRLIPRDVLYSSGWELKKGERPDGEGQPAGYYDGAFTHDYEYTGRSAYSIDVGDIPVKATLLNECNAAKMTLEDGTQTWAYFLTNTFPYIPRCFIGQPIEGAIIMNNDGKMVGSRSQR